MSGMPKSFAKRQSNRDGLRESCMKEVRAGYEMNSESEARRRVEDALREKSFRLIVDSIPSLVNVLKPDYQRPQAHRGGPAKHTSGFMRT
jgi:hypothetical protein